MNRLRLSLLCALLFALLEAPATFAQEPPPSGAIVLMDLSRSMTAPSFKIGYDKVQAAVRLAEAMLTDTYTPSAFPEWKKTELDSEASAALAAPQAGTGLLSRGQRVLVGFFGDRRTTLQDYRSFTFNGTRLEGPADFSGAFPESLFRDQQTHIALARGLTVERAAQEKMPGYYLLEITDCQGDTDGDQSPEDSSIVNALDSRLKVLRRYKAMSFEHTGTGKLRQEDKKKYTLFVNLWGIRLVRGGGKPFVDAVTVDPATPAADQPFTVSWNGYNMQPGDQYTVELLDNSRRSLKKETSKSVSHTFNGVPAGTYTVSVAFEKATSDPAVKDFTVEKAPPPVPRIEILTPTKDQKVKGAVKVEVKLPPGMDAATVLKAQITGGALAAPEEKDVSASSPASFTLPQGSYAVTVHHPSDSNASSLDTRFTVVPPDLGRISIVSPQMKEEIDGESVTIRWQAENPPEGIRYQVTLSGGSLEKQLRQETNSTSQLFSSLESGTYTAGVSAKGGGMSQASVTFEISSGISLWFWLVLLLALAGAAYLFMRRKHKPADLEYAIPAEPVSSPGPGKSKPSRRPEPLD